jgi:hypothetical protein
MGVYEYFIPERSHSGTTEYFGFATPERLLLLMACSSLGWPCDLLIIEMKF